SRAASTAPLSSSRPVSSSPYPPTPRLSTLSLHDALPIYGADVGHVQPEREREGGDVDLGVVREDADHAAGVDVAGLRGAGEEVVRPGPDDLGAGERRRIGERRPRVTHRQAMTQGPRGRDER